MQEEKVSDTALEVVKCNMLKWISPQALKHCNMVWDKKAIKRQLARYCSIIRWYYVQRVGECKRSIENNRFSVFRFGEVKIYAEFEILEQTSRYVFATLHVSRLDEEVPLVGFTYAMHIIKGVGGRGCCVFPIEEHEEDSGCARRGKISARPYSHRIWLKKQLVAFKRHGIQQYAMHGYGAEQQTDIGGYRFQMTPPRVLARQGEYVLVSWWISWHRKAWWSMGGSHGFTCVIKRGRGS